MRWLVTFVGGLVLLVVAAFCIARLRGPDEEQKTALALLKDTAPHPGRNAFALIWLLPYDIPEAQRELVLAEDVRRFEVIDAATAWGEATADFTTIAAKRYPAPLDPPDRERYCKSRDRDCLSKVRANPDAYARLLSADAALVARADSISQFGHVRNPFPPRLDMPFPPYSPLTYPLTQHALTFVKGDVDTALDGVCRSISGARMMMRDGDLLVTSMLGAAMLEGNVGLLADMLAELPPDHRLPASCTSALSPPAPHELLACNAMRGEARLFFASAQQIAKAKKPTGKPWLDWAWPLLYDADKTNARTAPRLAWYCGEQARASIAADMPAQAPPAPSLWEHPLQCADNLAGCILADVASPAYDGYQHRLQDAGIRLQVAATLLWLRDRPDGQSMPERLAQRPAALRSPHRELKISPDGTSISVELFDTRHGQRWSVPLPTSRRPAIGRPG